MTALLEGLPETELARLAAKYEGAQNHKELEAVLRRMMVLAPKSADYARRLGWTLLSLNRPSEAESVFEKAASIPGKDRWEALGGRAIALALQEKFSEALPLFEKAASNGYKTHQTQMYLLQAFNATGRYEDGLLIAEDLTRAQPNDPEMLLLHGTQLRWVGKFAEAARLMMQAMAINSEWGLYGARVIETLAAAGDFAEVIHLVPQFLKTKFDDVPLHQLFAHALASAYPDDAGEAYLQSMIAQDQNDLLAHYHLSLVLDKRHDAPGAWRAIEKCISLDPSSRLVLGQAGRVRIMEGRYAEGQELLQEVWRKSAERNVVRNFPAAKISSSSAIYPILYLPVEIGSRELHTRLIIASYAIALGFNAVILRHDVLKEAVSYLPPGVIIYKGISSQENELVVAARAAGHVFTVIDEESFGRTGDSFSALKNFDIRNLPFCDAVYGPGAAYCDRIAEYVPDAAPKLIPSGNPRTDLYEPKFLALYKDEVEAVRRDLGKTILVCTNFGGWNSTINSYAVVTEAALRLAGVEMDSPRGRWLLDICLDSAEAECRNTRTILAAMKELCAAFPEHKVILRPHPVEDIATWRYLLALLPNAIVNTQVSLPAQMMAADVTIHVPGCGTGLEARLLGRPVICLNTVKDLNFPKLGISGHLSPVADDVSTLVVMVKQAEAAPDTFGQMAREQEELMSLWIARSAESVSERIANHLLDLFEGRSGKKGHGRPRRLPPQLRNELERALRTARALEHAKSFSRIRVATNKKLHATPEKIRETIATIGTCIQLPVALHVEMPADDIFVVGPAL